jgi:hypothetical protein
MVLVRRCAWYSRRIRACAVAHACAADYVLGASNTNVCPGYSKITTEVTCRVAAGFLGKPYGGNTSYSFNPSGCYLNTAVGSVYLNVHPAGGTAPNAQPLCLGTGAPFQPPPSRTPQGYTVGWSTPWSSTAVVPHCRISTLRKQNAVGVPLRSAECRVSTQCVPREYPVSTARVLHVVPREYPSRKCPVPAV